MTNAVRGLLAPRRGQGMVEYAIGVSVLLLLTIGIVDLGRAVWTYNTLAHLAREGARYGASPQRTADEIRSYVVSRAVLPSFGTGNVAVTRGRCGVEAQPVVVTTSYRFDSITPLVSAGWGGGPLNLQSSSSMYVERGPVTAPGCA